MVLTGLRRILAFWADFILGDDWTVALALLASWGLVGPRGDGVVATTCGGPHHDDEHACVRCSMLWPDPNQRSRLVDIRDNLVDRIAEAEREGWLGEVEGLRVSLAGAQAKLAQIDRDRPKPTPVTLGPTRATPKQR